MKKLNCIITAFIVFILQAAVLPFIFNGVSQPNLIFVFVVLMGLHHGQRVGIATALLGGFCQDVIIGNFFGLHLLVYLIVTLVCSYLGRNIDKDQWILTLLIVLGATEAGLVLTCGFLFLAGTSMWRRTYWNSVYPYSFIMESWPCPWTMSSGACAGLTPFMAFRAIAGN
mgnify:CR=1 FL=1